MARLLARSARQALVLWCSACPTAAAVCVAGWRRLPPRSAWAARPLLPAGLRGWASSGVAPPPQGPPGVAAEGQKEEKKAELAIVFTCGLCDARSVRGFSRRAYERGVVIVECPGCESKHLIADRLGWFGEPGSVEDFLASKGEAVFRGAVDGTFEMTPEDAETQGLKPHGGGS